MLHRKGQELGIRANPHLWRHTAARHYLRNGGRVEALRVMLGHSTLDMTLHYARLEGADLTAAHETADPASKLRGR
jgi:integrase/recombinase XerD